MSLQIVILAAGQGTRMRSRLPKVLHPLAAKPLLQHVIETAQSLAPTRVCVVYGFGGEQVMRKLEHLPVEWAHQSQQLGTGHAVQQAIPHLNDSGRVLILYGDVPLTSGATLRRLLDSSRDEDAVALLTAHLANPFGYGRIIRGADGHVQRIVEEKDANEAERRINEINTGILALPAKRLKQWLTRLDNKNAQGEYYLTDVTALAVKDGVAVHTSQPQHEYEILGVNNRLQLAQLERIYQRNQADQLMTNGVTLADPNRIDIRGTISTAQDVTIDANVVLEGKIQLGANVTIGANCVLKDVVVADDAVILPFCHIESATIGRGARVGPYARVRPGTQLANDTHIGNFVEIKAAIVGEGSKVNHLSYVGDAHIGAGVNIGAGTITCNYDGANKHKTIIEDGVFVGSDTQLVAPVTVGKNATIGAGTTVTRNVPPDVLVVSRVPQKMREGWKRPTKKPKS